MEIRGVLYKAGLEQSKAGDKQIFKIGVRPTGGKDWDLTLFDSNIIATCEKLRGKQVAVIAEKPEGTKYWNVLGVKEATGEPKPEAQIHESIDKKETDWDKIGRQKARCDLFQSACHLLAGVYGTANAVAITNLGEQAVIIAQIGEAYVFGETNPAATELGKLFWKACKAAGYDPDTKKGVEDIKAWLKKAGKTELEFKDLSPEKAGELIKMMQAEKLP